MGSSRHSDRDPTSPSYGKPAGPDGSPLWRSGQGSRKLEAQSRGGALTNVPSLAEVGSLRPDRSISCRRGNCYKERRRGQSLSPQETGRPGEVPREAEREMTLALAAFRPLLLTGCRPSEIHFQCWKQVKYNCIELLNVKTDRRVVSIAPEALAVRCLVFENPWVIDGKLPGSLITALQNLRCRNRARAGPEDMRSRDRTHSHGSRALALAEGLTMIDKLWGHTQVQTTAQ